MSVRQESKNTHQGKGFVSVVKASFGAPQKAFEGTSYYNSIMNMNNVLVLITIHRVRKSVFRKCLYYIQIRYQPKRKISVHPKEKYAWGL